MKNRMIIFIMIIAFACSMVSSTGVIKVQAQSIPGDSSAYYSDSNGTLSQVGLDKQIDSLALLGTNCTSPVEFDNQWSNGYRLVCQNNLYVLIVDLTNPAIKVEVIASSSGNKTVSSYADSNTIAIINADYHWCESGSICSQGLTISNGSNPTSYTNIDHLCSDALVRREIGFTPDMRPVIDWWYKFVSDSQAKAWCEPRGHTIPGPGGGLEQYNYNLVGGGPQFTFDGTFHWDCQYGTDPITHNCKDSVGDVGINGEHFGIGDWWNRYQSAIGYSTDGTTLVLAESNNRTHTMQEVHDIMYQRLNAYGKNLKNAFKFDGGHAAGFWYYNSTYNSTPSVLVPNVIRIERNTTPCYSLSTNVNPSGAGSVNVITSSNCAQGKFLQGTNVQIQANANSGYTFSNWSGDAGGSNNPDTITMDGNKNITANFSYPPPTLSWVAPVGDEQVFDVFNQTILLEVNATSIGGINRVEFYRWDYINLISILIGTVSSSPYRIYFDTSTLLPDWNEVYALGYDNAGDLTDKYIWLNHIDPSFSKSSPLDGASGVETSPTLSWGTSNGATSYDYCYNTTNTCSGWTSNGTTTSKALNGLSNNTTYYWQVRANNAGGIIYADGISTAYWSFTTTSPTDISLANYKATSLPQGIQLSWQTAQENDLLGFNLYRAESPEGLQKQINSDLITAINPGQLQGNNYLYLDQFAEAGKTYYYWVEWVGINSSELYGPEKAILAQYFVWLPLGLK